MHLGRHRRPARPRGPARPRAWAGVALPASTQPQDNGRRPLMPLDARRRAHAAGNARCRRHAQVTAAATAERMRPDSRAVRLGTQAIGRTRRDLQPMPASIPLVMASLTRSRTHPVRLSVASNSQDASVRCRQAVERLLRLSGPVDLDTRPDVRRSRWQLHRVEEWVLC